MIPREAWPLLPTTRRALAETIADGRHEWQSATGFVASVRAAVRFGVALVVAICASAAREVASALISPFPLRWLVAACVLSVALPTIPLWRAGFHLHRWPRPDECLLAFLATLPISTYLSAVPGRRSERVPVGGMSVLIALMLMLTLVLALPIAQAGFFARSIGGQLYLPVPASIAIGFGLPCLVVCICELLVLERARRHRRRAFLSVLVLLSPILTLTLQSALSSSSSVMPTGLGFALFWLTVALPIAAVWMMLVLRESGDGVHNRPSRLDDCTGANEVKA